MYVIWRKWDGFAVHGTFPQAEKITVPFPVTVFRDDHHTSHSTAACGSNTVSCTGYNTPYGPKSSLVKEPLKEAKEGGTGDVGCLNLDLQGYSGSECGAIRFRLLPTHGEFLALLTVPGLGAG